MAQNLNQQVSGPLIDSKDLITTSKGWDLRIFRDENLAKRFLCAICYNVCRNAHELSCSAAHLFCESCINELSSSNGNKSNIITCPIDHEMNVSHQASRFVSRHILELYVYCPRSQHVCSKLMKNANFNNNTLFCNFSGQLADLISHTSHSCIFNVISCPFHLIGCPINKMYRYSLSDHINNSQNKHINLSLQKIQKLQKLLKTRENSNDTLCEQLSALKIASTTKNNQIDQFKQENINLKLNNNKLINQCNKLNDDLKLLNKRIDSYQKAVNLLKNNNQKLVQQIDQQHQQQQQQQQQMHQQQAHPLPQQASNDISDQFNNLLLLQKQNNNSFTSNNSMINNLHNSNNNNNPVAPVSVSVSAASVSSVSSASDEKQPNSTDVVCTFLKEHPELVSKLKNSNQIMYANIITDDKYAAQFLKKMLQSGNDEYRNEISNIVNKLQQT